MKLRGRYPIVVEGFFAALAPVGLLLGWAGLLTYGLDDRRVGYLLVSLAFTALIPLSVTTFAKTVASARFAATMEKCPTSIHVEPGPNGLVAIVTLRNGEAFSLPLPDGYDPNDDDGRWVLEQVVPPELRDGLRLGEDAEE